MPRPAPAAEPAHHVGRASGSEKYFDLFHRACAYHHFRRRVQCRERAGQRGNVRKVDEVRLAHQGPVGSAHLRKPFGMTCALLRGVERVHHGHSRIQRVVTADHRIGGQCRLPCANDAPSGLPNDGNRARQLKKSSNALSKWNLGW
jgi:hypothetical protein